MKAAAPFNQASYDMYTRLEALFKCGKKDFAAIDALIDAGARMNPIANDLLISLAGYGYIAGLEAMLKAGADIDFATLNGNTPLMVATWRGHRGFVEILLEHGADIEPKNDHNYDAISYGWVYDHPDIARLLEVAVQQRKDALQQAKKDAEEERARFEQSLTRGLPLEEDVNIVKMPHLKRKGLSTRK